MNHQELPIHFRETLSRNVKKVDQYIMIHETEANLDQIELRKRRSYTDAALRNSSTPKKQGLEGGGRGAYKIEGESTIEGPG